MSIATKLQTVYDGVEDVRDALQELDPTLGRGTIDTLGDDIRSLITGGGYGFQVYGDVRTEEDGEEPGTTDYVYTKSLILDSTLVANGEDINTDVIDGIGELDGDMVDISGGKVQIPLNTGVVLTVDPSKTYVKFRDPVVESIVLTNWGVDGKITLAQVRAITTTGSYFQGSSIVTFNELKWFDGLTLVNFTNCTNLTEIKLPRITSFGSNQNVFTGCTSLAHLEIPDSFTNLGIGNSGSNGIFKNTNIEELIIPNSVTSIATATLADMPELKRIVWGDNLPFPKQSNSSYPDCYFYNCPKLEKIENLPVSLNTTNTRFNFKLDAALDFTNILPLVLQLTDAQLANNFEMLSSTNIFDYAPNGIAVFDGLRENTSNNALAYCFASNSEAGFILSFPNWTVNPSVQRASRVGKVIFSDSVTSMGNFANVCNASEYILPCTTPPTLSGSLALQEQARIYVPEASLSSYQSATYWSAVSNKIKAYRDPSLATFCSIPAAAPVPTNYTKVQYISNIDGEGTKNCQISNLGYIPKQYSQVLFDFEHKFLQTTSNSEAYACLISTPDDNYKDFRITIFADDNDPKIFRLGHTNNRMGLPNKQVYYFNSHVTGEAFGNRSVMKFSHKFMEYHGLVHQVDETTGDSTETLMLLRYNNNNNMTSRQVKIYRLCFFEPVANAADYDDPANYEIVRDYIPAMRNSDGVYGLYERLTDTFYPSTKSPFSGPAYE